MREPGTKWGPKASLPLIGMGRKRRKIRTPPAPESQALLIQKGGSDGTDLMDRQEGILSSQNSMCTDTMGEKSRQVQETLKVWSGCSRGAREKEIGRGSTGARLQRIYYKPLLLLWPSEHAFLSLHSGFSHATCFDLWMLSGLDESQGRSVCFQD